MSLSSPDTYVSIVCIQFNGKYCIISTVLSIISLRYVDELANKYLTDWTIDRLDNLGATILRMSLYEITYTDTPPVVVINEAIELAKKYSDENVRKMINAVLDKIVNE